MIAFSFFLLLMVPATTTNAFSLAFRSATPEDLQLARKTLFQEKMNTLSISQERLLVAIDDDDDDDDDDGKSKVLGFGQIRPLDAAYSELASLYVMPESRRQGVARGLIGELLERQDDQSDVCLLTLTPTVPLYEPFGFVLLKEPLEDMPASFKFEFKAGALLSVFLKNNLVCMVKTCRENKKEEQD